MVEIGCIVHCNIIWLPSLLYYHVLVAKPFEVVSLKAAIAVRQKQEIYWDELSDRLPTFFINSILGNLFRQLAWDKMPLVCLDKNGLESGCTIKEHLLVYVNVDWLSHKQ